MAFTGATAGLAAGAQTNDTRLDYALEATYKVSPTGNYQALRITGDSLSRSQTTSRPDEINEIKEVAQSVVTQISASGSISGALSTTTYDDFLSGVFGDDWLAAPPSVTVSATATATLTPKSAAVGGHDLISGSISFASFPDHGTVRVLDPTNQIDAFVPYISLDGGLRFVGGMLPVTTDTALSNGSTITLADIENSNVDKTFTVRKKILGNFLMYPGSLINQAQIQLQQGQFGTVSFDLLSANEVRSQTDLATSVLPAPTGKVHNTVNNFLGCWINGIQPEGCVTTATLTFGRDGSGSDYGLGHADACGVRSGSFTASGSIEFYFRTWDQYQQMLDDVQAPIVIKTADDAGNGYAFVFKNAALRNGKIPTSGKNQTFKVSFDLEGNPAEESEGTCAIFRLVGAFHDEAPVNPIHSDAVTLGGQPVTMGGSPVTLSNHS